MTFLVILGLPVAAIACVFLQLLLLRLFSHIVSYVKQEVADNSIVLWMPIAFLFVAVSTSPAILFVYSVRHLFEAGSRQSVLALLWASACGLANFLSVIYIWKLRGQGAWWTYSWWTSRRRQ